MTSRAAASLGVGLAALGRPGYINLGHGDDLAGHTDVAAMERNAHDVLDAAYAAGVRYFDAARSYGRAESFLASWLEARGVEPGDVFVASKWGYRYTADWQIDAEQQEVKDLSAATLRRQTDESNALLGPYLDLYQIHSATLESGVLEDNDVLDELQRLRKSGLEIGLTVSGPAQAATVERALETDMFDAVQATWNLLERSADSALAAAHAAGLRVIVKETLANGRLTSRGDIQLLLEAAGEKGTSPDALALAVVLAQPWADTVLTGPSTVEMLESNLVALDLQVDEELDTRLAALAEEPAAYWSERSTLAWN
jgi:aryl-alcohol dehydrogenase-like predicted oxidoreductase